MHLKIKQGHLVFGSVQMTILFCSYNGSANFSIINPAAHIKKKQGS
jgi:hypothetical protein